ncbi:E3 ubiquitin-protein ligase TRIM71-like [Saccoglossus kowalevskii]|uniref:E3 ubiquitin-protein ligase TRIM71-like n=1 Tax=Saccoglossus kowalevskii TaxID=10224 RepID=A0ABM0GWC0_SACKO|nr:PREDICTED: E3 ubiquitin-protein ligase TRIM71-like [Saccoglossus kowalevskii]
MGAGNVHQTVVDQKRFEPQRRSMVSKRSVVDEIDEDLLTCSVCLERYKNPQILPCYHSFCEQCLVKLKGPRDTIKCPNCRQLHYVSNMQQLSPSTIINSVIDIIKEHEIQRCHGTCHGCEENSSTNRCVDCAMDLCTTCTNAHRKMPVSQHHRIMNIEELKKAKLNDKSIVFPAVYCTSHQDKLIELYCEKCQIPICHLCLRSNHKGHTVIDLQGAADRFCKMASDHIQLLKAKQSEVKQSKISATKQSEESTKQHLHRKQQITKHSQETIEKLTKIIKQEENSHMTKLKTDYDKMNEEINRQIHQYETTEELLTSTITFINNLLQYSSAAQLMKTSKETTNQLETMMSLDTTWNDKNNSLPQFYPGDITLQGMLGTFQSMEVDSVSYSYQQTREPSHVINAPMKLEKTIEGTEPGMFDYPLGVRINTCGDIVVADHENKRVQIIDIYGTPKSQLQFTGYSKPVRPIDVAVSVDNTYFITDGIWEGNEGNNQVIVCNQYGKVIKCFGGKELQDPCGIAINHNNGIVYVVDNDAHCIRLYENTGFKYIKSVGSEGQGSCQFDYPYFIAINSKGCLIVSDAGNNRIQVLTSDGVFMFAFSGRPNDKFDWPNGVTTDKNDNIYVCDYSNHRVQMFNSKGEFITNIASGSDVLCYPTGIAITDDGKVVVTDCRHCVKIFT